MPFVAKTGSIPSEALLACPAAWRVPLPSQPMITYSVDAPAVYILRLLAPLLPALLLLLSSALPLLPTPSLCTQHLCSARYPKPATGVSAWHDTVL